MIEALDIQVRGIVQGVGFRPFVYRMAKKYLINGWVLNATDGVFIHAEGEGKLLDEFVIELSENPPAASQVDEIELKEVPLEGFDSFEIRFSDAGAVEKTTLISPDLATCEDCARELANPNDRRYRYPFINCTNCGPRFTIIEKLPYDRKNTSMKEFPMCSRCQSEYDEPLDRRFHAQPNACFECGPKVSWRVTAAGLADGAAADGGPAAGAAASDDGANAGCDAASAERPVEWGATREESDAIFAKACAFLREGKILAVKGLGGFHLVCDAENEAAVAELRLRKRREGKAFAVMMKDMDAVRRVCEVNEAEERLLTGSQRPIVLLKKRIGASFVPGLADGLTELGVMLPYTPVQHLLLADYGGMLVMTSGNIHDEPIVTDDDEAYRVLGGIADAILGNNRAICARYDDSVVRVLELGEAGQVIQFVRRARGYAPMPLALPLFGGADGEGDGGKAADEGAPNEAAGGPASDKRSPASIFATGPEQKNTFCLTRENEAFVSQHIGDMENAETYDAWLSAKALYERLFEIAPERIACDLHPEYLTSKWAHEQNLPVVEVQHHHAHIVSVMAENKLEGPVAGFAFDGTGFGADGNIWGGEVLLCNLAAYERFANFAYVPMPGGAAAIKNPLRMAYGVLWAFDLLEHPGARKALGELGEAADVCGQMIDRGLNTPLTSSVGRLFDAASALLGICIAPKYEGEGAILLEAAISAEDRTRTNVSRETLDVADADAAERYAIDIVKNTATSESTALDTSVVLYDAAPTFKALLDDYATGVAAATIARRFHDAFVTAIVQGARLIRATYGIDAVALSGGVFLNRYIMEHAISALAEQGFTVAVNRDLPPSDGCISFGQAVVGLRL